MTHMVKAIFPLWRSLNPCRVLTKIIYQDFCILHFNTMYILKLLLHYFNMLYYNIIFGNGSGSQLLINILQIKNIIYYAGIVTHFLTIAPIKVNNLVYY